MKRKPDIDAFLQGGTVESKTTHAESETAEARSKASSIPTNQIPAEPARLTKTIRLDADLESLLKEATHERWKQTGKKAAESDIINDALRNYFKR